MGRWDAESDLDKLCACGCGEVLLPWKSGKPHRFRHGHNGRFRERYYRVQQTPTGAKYQHVVVAEQVLGHTLPAGAVVHHVNGNIMDNRPANLVICQDRAYHNLLHTRIRVQAAGGDPNTQAICSTCKRLLWLLDFYPNRSMRRGRANECKDCSRAKVAAYQQRRRTHGAMERAV